MKKIKMLKKVETMDDGRKINVYQFEIEGEPAPKPLVQATPAPEQKQE
ncbi:MAG: hypothetical protein ACYC1M_00030 [Armatimonadota bacterium]